MKGEKETKELLTDSPKECVLESAWDVEIVQDAESVENIESLEDILPEDYQFNLSDFALFLSVMKNKKAYRNVLSIILDEDDLELMEVKVEQVILNKVGKRAIRLDAWALDTRNRQFSTEMQNDTTQDDMRKRSRFYQSMLDTPVLKSGRETKYKNLPSTVIIFITQDDIFKRDLVKYTFTEQCEEIQGLHLEDGTTKIFLNMTSKNGRPELVSLLQYMKVTTMDNPEIVVKDSRIVELAEIVEEVKQSEEWEAVQMNLLEIGIAKGITQGQAEDIRKLMKNLQMTAQQAMDTLEIPPSEQAEYKRLLKMGDDLE